MKKEELIKKWLDNELTLAETQEFKQLEEYDSFMKLSDNASFFKAPNFNSSEEYKKILPIIDGKRTTKTLLSRIKPILKLAAVFVMGIVVYTAFFLNNETTINTFASEKTVVILPDNSIAQLNSLSELSYNKDAWNKQRKVELKGEAYFKVAKGSQFDVQTSTGVVTVLGTQFNVKNRLNYFEVVCYEGKVSVTHKNKNTILTPGKTVRILNGKMTEDATVIDHPTWIDDYSSFNSVAFSEVIAEFERQYNVNIEADIDSEILFTGTFTHTNKKLALLAITIPLNLKSTIENNTIRLYE
jgi:ferric-dicitrate binding protein FerR (iron transport regulator)